MSVSTILAVLLAASATQSGDCSAVEETVAALYAPYSGEITSQPVWERPIFSREISELIGQWRAVVPEDEPDALNDGDWLCLCQEWDPKEFAARIDHQAASSDDAGEVRVTLNLGWDVTREARLLFRQEGGQWRLDDLFATEYPAGLKQALRDTIRADTALKEGKQ